MSSTPRAATAAFYDMDGTLISANVVHAYAYYALNAQHVRQRVTKTAALVASLPMYWLADKIDRKLFNEAFYRNYEGFSEDRLVLLGEEVFEKILKPSIFKGAPELVRRSREQGHRQVLITGAIAEITAPLAAYLGMDDSLSNRLEYMDGVATGRLIRPFIGGANKALLMRQYGERHGLNLDQSFAYADSGSDLPMLSVVGNPCAVNPDWRMRTTAQAYDWPIIDLDR